MKNKNLLLAIMAALVVAIGAIIFLTREPAPSPASKTEPESAEPSAASLPAATASPAVAQAPIKMPPTQATKEPGLSVLATVNGVPITEKDLAPAGAPPSQSLARQATLDRAIDRELILQAANAQGIRLTVEQEKILAELPQGVVNSAAFDGGKAPEVEARMQAEIDFRAREATAQFLLSTLAPPPKDAAYLNGLRAAAKIEMAQ